MHMLRIIYNIENGVILFKGELLLENVCFFLFMSFLLKWFSFTLNVGNRIQVMLISGTFVESL